MQKVARSSSVIAAGNARNTFQQIVTEYIEASKEKQNSYTQMNTFQSYVQKTHRMHHEFAGHHGAIVSRNSIKLQSEKYTSPVLITPILVFLCVFVLELKARMRLTNGRTDGQDTYCGLLGRPHNKVVSRHSIPYCTRYDLDSKWKSMLADEKLNTM